LEKALPIKNNIRKEKRKEKKEKWGGYFYSFNRTVWKCMHILLIIGEFAPGVRNQTRA